MSIKADDRSERKLKINKVVRLSSETSFQEDTLSFNIYPQLVCQFTARGKCQVDRTSFMGIVKSGVVCFFLGEGFFFIPPD